MANPEAQLFARMDREGVFGEYYSDNEAFNRLAKEWNTVRPRYSDFTEVYEKGAMQKDAALVASIKHSPEYTKERSSESVALEYALMEGIQNGWFGPDAYVVPSNEFDDVVNGIDFVVAMPTGIDDEVSYVGIDVTTSNDIVVIDKKLHRTSRQLAKNSIGRVKYFIDDQNPDKRGQKFVPRVVVGIEAERARAIQDELGTNRNYELDERTRQELLQEVELQIVQSAKFLLERWYGPSARRITNVEDVIAYVDVHHEAIQEENPRLFENVQKYVATLRAIRNVGLDTKNPDELTQDAGFLLDSLRRRNRFVA